MSEIAVKDKSQTAWELFHELISKTSLDLIPTMPVVPIQDDFKEALSTVRVDRITKIVYDKSEDNLLKFNSIFSAVNSSDSAVFVMLRNLGTVTEIYLGINADDTASKSTSMSIFEGALQGNFPGIIVKDIDSDFVVELSEVLRQGNCVSCVTGIPSQKNDKNIPFSQGLEKIIDALGSEQYTALFLATPVSREILGNAEQAYRNIYSQLSLMNINQMSLTSQQSQALGKTLGKSFSTALSTNISRTNTTTHSESQTQTKSLAEAKSIGVTKGHTDTTSQSTSTSISDATGTNTSRTRNWGGAAATGGAAAGALIGSVLPGLGTLLGAGIGAAVGGVAGSLIGSTMTGTSQTHTETKTETDSQSYTETESETQTNTMTATNSNAATEGSSTAVAEQTGEGKVTTEQDSEQTSDTKTLLKGISYNYAIVEKNIVEAQKIIEEQLERIRQCKNYGAWNWAAYFIGDTTNVTSMGANIFSGILRGEQSGVERSAIINWNSSNDDFSEIKDSLAKFRHPIFRMHNGQLFSPASLLSTPELSVGMALPQKSLPGLPVFSAAEFGRSVVHLTETNSPGNLFKLGNIVHLDREYKANAVELDLNSLTSHAFITGSTGSGKSNAIYNLLKSLRSKNIPFLVIEPSKGEYKDVFGGLRTCKVYGTNPYQTPLLKINPFSFPDGIHVMEHIDRLIEILNAAWPMYAAMPAILKTAVEKTYENCGWNLLTSVNSYSSPVFPDFTDLLKILPDIIESSQYSEEVTSNYKGALVTRVSSMTNGYFRSIFQKDELSPEKLFDTSVIIDLSRVSSVETKALLMGVLFQKLQEYRISTADEANKQLRHVTVLEEAHHLLRKTSIAQGDESANLCGKSIEMLTNAIAEMRTYGEAFIIADQAPDLLDPAVIRNTNTKIAFNLPNFVDRDLVGKAQGLTEEQIEELAHLRRGYASVYQNNWQQAVICKTDLFDPTTLTNMGTAPKYSYHVEGEIARDSRTEAEIALIRIVLQKLNGTESIDSALIEKTQQYFPEEIKDLQEADDNTLICIINELLVKNKIEANHRTDIRTAWTRNLIKSIFNDERVKDLPIELKDQLLLTVFSILAMYDQNPQQREDWKAEKNNLDMWRTW